MTLRKLLRTCFVGIILLVPAIVGKGKTETVLDTDISKHVSIDDLRDPGWGDATPDADVRDEDYFEFTTKNFDESLVGVWYSIWTMLRQNDTAWSEMGEWKLFTYDWQQTKNFECSLSMSQCSGDRTLEGLQSLYPGEKNRPLVRRIFFVYKAYRIFHNYGNLVQSSFERIKNDLVPMVPELVGAFTQQADAHGDRMCALVRTLGETLISVGVAFTAAAVGTALGPVATDPQQTMQAVSMGITITTNAIASVGQPTLKKAIKKAAKKAATPNKGLPGFLKKLSDQLKPIQWTSNGMQFTYHWWSTFQNFPFIYYMSAANLIQAARAEYGAMDVEGGSGDGGWARACSAIEGDFANRNPYNIEKLQTWIPGQFQFIRNRVQRFYKDIYEGQIPYRGGPSMMSFLLAGNAWTGEDSFLTDLKDTEQWQHDMERNFVKGIISKLLAKSYNYMACTHDPKAPSMCEAAQKYSEPSSKWDAKMSTLSRSRFCPRPDADPNLICQVEKWYFAVNNQHSRAMNGLDSFESFQRDRFKFRRDELLQESYDNYVRCGGNNCTNMDWYKGPFSRDMSFTGNFHMPTCQSDRLTLTDFTRYWGWKAHPGKTWKGHQNGEWTQWNFPSVCGDHHASETRDFLEAMNAGVHSDVYAHHYYYRSTDQLWKDRIPRQLEALELPPYNHFVAMCGAGVYLPGRLFVGESDKKIARSPQQGIHHRCKEVTDATAGMDEFAANKWFCVDSTIGRDIQDDSPRRRYHLLGTPRRHLKTYKQRCALWRKDGKGSGNAGDEGDLEEGQSNNSTMTE